MPSTAAPARRRPGTPLTIAFTLGTAPYLGEAVAGNVSFYLVRLALPSLVGGVTMREADNPESGAGDQAHAFACVLKAVP